LAITRLVHPYIEQVPDISDANSICENAQRQQRKWHAMLQEPQTLALWLVTLKRFGGVDCRVP